jgi:hypothetical protein
MPANYEVHKPQYAQLLDYADDALTLVLKATSGAQHMMHAICCPWYIASYSV